MHRKEWCLEDYIITDKLYKGYASMGEQQHRPCCQSLQEAGAKAAGHCLFYIPFLQALRWLELMWPD
jgi:hypothetical protein